MAEQGVAGGVRSTKDRNMPALEARAGKVAVGHTSQDTVGLFSSTNGNRVKVARRGAWVAQSLSVCLRLRA